MAILRHVLLLQKDVPRAAKYYAEGVGLQLRVLTETWAELDAGGSVIALKACDGCAPPAQPAPRVRWLSQLTPQSLQQLRPKQAHRQAHTTTGYSPFLAFQVTGLQDVLQRILPMGAEMDGPIKFSHTGKVAAVRNPDGHMMSLFEPE